MNNLYKKFIITGISINFNICSIPSRNIGANIAINFSSKVILGIVQLKSNAESARMLVKLKV